VYKSGNIAILNGVPLWYATDFLTNSRLMWKNLSRIKGLAFFAAASMTMKKSFIRLTRWESLILIGLDRNKMEKKVAKENW
jgi:hypothetical protein